MQALKLLTAALAVAIGVGSGQVATAKGIGDAKFISVPLGTAGGLTEDNLTAYLLAPVGSQDFVALDAGTLLTGLQRARRLGSLEGIVRPRTSDLSLEGYVLHHKIKAYLISHAHVDHIAGMALNATDDESKPIMATDTTIDYLRDHVFNWKLWPAFGDEGEGFQLKKYHFKRLQPGAPEKVAGTKLEVEAMPLSHANGYPSTAFLLGSGGAYVLYCGDTGPDKVEKSDALKQVWTRVAPLVREKALRAVFIEASYPDVRPAKLLFGHLTPSWLMQELHVLAKLVDPQRPETALEGLTVVVTHIKPSLKRGEAPEKVIPKQLAQLNDLHVRFVFPKQGQKLEL